jgi:hypothetical protein
VYDNGGVENDKDKAVFKWGIWEPPILISIVDDSLALLVTYKSYYKEWGSCGFDGCTTHDLTTNYRIGLFLVNYREKQKPVWGDTLESNFVIAESYFKDSSVLVFDRSKDKFGFWKIGTNAKDVKLIDYANNSGKEKRLYMGYKIRPLTNGNIAFFGSGDAFRNSLLLETKNKQLKLFEFSGEYEWLSKCANSLTNNYGYNPDDGPYYTDYNYDYANVSYIGGELSCIKGNEATNNFELTVNNVVRDTSSLSKSSSERITNWYGNYIKDAENKFYKIDTLNFKFDSSYVPMWGSYSSFCFYKENKNSDSSVSYFAQDLIDFFL